MMLIYLVSAVTEMIRGGQCNSELVVGVASDKSLNTPDIFPLRAMNSSVFATSGPGLLYRI